MYQNVTSFSVFNCLKTNNESVGYDLARRTTRHKPLPVKMQNLKLRFDSL